MIRCPHCGRETPEGGYCIYCGTQLSRGTRPSDAQRWHAYAAYPREHVLHLSVITTLFPHLTPSQTHRARWLLLGCALVIFFIGVGRLVPLAIVLGVVLFPLLYLAYFYFTHVFEDEPLPVLLATFVCGAVMGALMSAVFYPIILGQRRLAFGRSPGYILLTGLALPLLAQALMLVGPLVLYVFRPRFDHLLDGLVFGAASGLGFAAAQSIVYSWLLLQGPFLQNGLVVSWVLPVLRIALFVPLLDAATTALICGAIWLNRDRQIFGRSAGWIASPRLAALIGVLGQTVPSLGYDLIGGQVMALVWYGAAAAVLLILLRVLVHDGLLERKSPRSSEAPLACPHCGRLVPPDAAFCPHCGFALGTPPYGRSRPVPPSPEPDQLAETPGERSSNDSPGGAPPPDRAAGEGGDDE